MQEAEASKRLQDAVQDASNKADLLRKELGYNEALAATIDSIQIIAGQLDAAQDAIAEGELEQGLQKLEEAGRTLSRLDPLRNMRFSSLLHRRRTQMTSLLTDKVQDCWNKMVEVRPREREISLRTQGDGKVFGQSFETLSNRLKVVAMDISTVADLMSRLGVLEKTISRLHSDLDNIIISPRFSLAIDRAKFAIQLRGNTIQVSGPVESSDVADAIRDLRQVLDFLNQKLPEPVFRPLLDRMLPSLILQLVDSWLNPLIPVSLDELAHFDGTIQTISELASYISAFKISLPSDADLSSWIDELPSSWMARRREAALADMRNACYKAVKIKKVVERSETQTVAHDDALVANDKADDAWNEDWDDEDAEQGSHSETAATNPKAGENEEEDEDASAWGLEEDEAPVPQEEEAERNPEAAHTDGGDEEDAWGWGDEAGQEAAVVQKSTSPNFPKPEKKAKSPHKKVQASTREITLRETYTVTRIPETIIELISHIIRDAEVLSSPKFPIREVSVAAPALSSLPTLLLAFYRATATSFYSADPAANMLIYNDTQQLTTEIEGFTKTIDPAHPLAKRLRLENDIKQLHSYAKRAYGREMDSQRTILRDLLSSASGFVNTSSPINAREYQNTIDDTIQRIRDVDALWKPVLSSSALLQSIGSLLSTVTGRMTSDILELADEQSGISEEQSKILKGFCDKVVSASDLFSQHDPATGEDRTLVHVYSPDWLRFVYLGEILEASLADIKYLWTEGELSLEFAQGEVVDLIEALFADSEHRRNAIREIKSSGTGR